VCRREGRSPDRRHTTRRRSGQPRSPLRRISGGVHDPINRHRLIDEFVEHCIRKPADQSPPKLASDTCMEFRRATDPLQTREDAVEKLATEPGPLFLVPAEASGCVGSCIRCEANLNRHGAVPAAERSSHPTTGPTPDGKRDWPGDAQLRQVARGGRARLPAGSRHHPRDPRPAGVSRRR